MIEEAALEFPSNGRSVMASPSGCFLHKKPRNLSEEDMDGIQDKSLRGWYLPDHLLHILLSFLDIIDLYRAALVCRQWRRVSAHDDLGRYFNFKSRYIPQPQFANICRRYPSATQLNLYGSPLLLNMVSTASTFLLHLETLHVGGDTCQIEYSAFFQALKYISTLTTLSVRDATPEGSNRISVDHDGLQNLHITNCKVLSISVRCPQLEILSMKGTKINALKVVCPRLLELDLGSCVSLSDARMGKAVMSCPLLTSLDISNCSNVTQNTLSLIALKCPRLHSLIASESVKISFESIRLPLLKVLKLENCVGITSASMVAISHCPLLEVLELHGCGNLESVSLDLKQLRKITLTNCLKLIKLNLQTSMLSSVTISNCPSLHQIFLSTYSLQKLVQRQDGLANLTMHCPVLPVVELTECPSSQSFVSDGGGCPALGSCENLIEVKVCSTSLVSVSIAGCSALISLELACPYLARLHLDGCDHLERALLSSVNLGSLNLGMCSRLKTLQIEAPKLVVLQLMGCGALSNASVRCPCIKSLDFSFCIELADTSLRETIASCPLIETLILTSCSSIGPDGLTSLGVLQHLTLLDVSYTDLMNLHPIFESCLRLKVLKAQACKYLADSSFEPLYRDGALPALRELDLSYGTFSQSAIEELLACCTRLSHVSLNGCVNLHEYNGVAPACRYSSPQDIVQPNNHLLENLNMVGCQNLNKVAIPATLYCGSLSSLNLSLSVNLRVVEIACVTLSILNLSRCCSLEILKLDCPRLTTLVLGSCGIAEEALEAAISHCSMLETLDFRSCPPLHPVRVGRLRRVRPNLKRVFSSSAIS